MTNPNDPAFVEKWEGAEKHTTHGISKREYFAAMALSGMIAGSQGLNITSEQFGKQSVILADSLIKELNK